MNKTKTHSPRCRRAVLFGAALAGLFASSGCEQVPDPCLDYPLACLAVTIDSGPADVRQVRAFVADGLDTYTEVTPKKQPKMGLVYPLRFAVRFGQFDNLYRGSITLEASALGVDYDVLGFVRTSVAIKGTEQQTVALQFGPPPDVVGPPLDEGVIDFATPDMQSPPDGP